MNLSLILALILATILGLGGAGTAGYHKGKADAERAAKIAMSEHLAEDREAERVATEAADRYKDALATAQNAVSAAYEKGKADAEANAKRVVADLRAGNLILHDRWTSCQASSGLPRPALPPIPANLMQEPQTEMKVRDELFRPLPNATFK